MVKRQRIDQRAETNSPRALRHGSQEHAGRRRHPAWRRMMFRNMIGVETRLVISLNELEACLRVFLERQVAAIQMVEYTKLHRSDEVLFAIVVENLMRFVGESTGRVRMWYAATRKS